MEEQMLKKLLASLLLLCMFVPACAAEGGWQPIPDVLRFSYVIGGKEPFNDTTYLRCSYPQTVLPRVNNEIRALVDDLSTRRHLYPHTVKEFGYLDVSCRISRSGKSMMSFLITARKVEDRLQTAVEFENRVYDMQTGERIFLSHLFPDDSAAWALIGAEVEKQLNAYYPTLEGDQNALSQLCQKEALQQASFSLTPVQLEIHYPANSIYPGKCTLMHVRIPYRTLRPYMTAYAYEQTDNNGYQLAALTYDDGPARNSSNLLIDQLLAHGAGATFFVVGSRMEDHQDILCREQDSGFSIGSHNWEHINVEKSDKRLLQWKTDFDRTLSDICGITPSLLRAPGGHFKHFQRANVGLTFIHWSMNSRDASTGSTSDAGTVGRNVGGGTDAGSIVLMHDLKANSPQYTQILMERLEKRNILCVTVEDLLIHYGVDPVENEIYYGFEDYPIPPLEERSNVQ